MIKNDLNTMTIDILLIAFLPVSKSMERMVVMDVMMGKTRMMQGGIDKMVRGAAVMNKIMVW